MWGCRIVGWALIAAAVAGGTAGIAALDTGRLLLSVALLCAGTGAGYIGASYLGRAMYSPYSFVTSCHLESAPAFSRAFRASAQFYRGFKDFGVLPAVVAPFEFRDVERQILGANMTEAAHDAALQQRPEAINGLSVDQPALALIAAVPGGLVRIVRR